MRIVHIDDEREVKLNPLKDKAPISEQYETPEGLNTFLQSIDTDPGMVILDVAAFYRLNKLDMLRIGESLADHHWTVVYWSAAVGPDDVREDCWFEDRNNSNGIATIAEAIKNGMQSSGLRPGRRNLDPTGPIFELLTSLLTIGWVWEASQSTGRAALKASAKTLDLSLFPDLQCVFATRLQEHVSGRAAEEWPIPKANEREVFGLSKLVSETEYLKEPLPERKHGEPLNEKAILDAAIKSIANSETLMEWNARVTELRDSLLPSPS